MRDNDKEIVVRKFWSDSGKLLRTVIMDQMIMLCALLMIVYNDKIELVNTDETTLEVSKIYYWPTGSHYGIGTVGNIYMAYDIECAYERWLQNIVSIRLPIIQQCFMHCKHYTIR